MTLPSEQSLARSAMYELLSLAFLYPEEGRLTLLADGAQKITAVASKEGWEQTHDALEKLSQSFDALTDDALLQEYTEVFGHSVSSDCPPYEGEYGQAHVFQKSHTLADLNAFYAAFGVATNPELKDRQDHVSVELEFMHLLTLKEAYAEAHGHGDDKVALCRRAQQGFLANHLAQWIKVFVSRLRAKADASSIYAPLANLLGAHIDAELQRFQLTGAVNSGMKSDFAGEGDGEGIGCPLSSDVQQEVGPV